MQAIVASTLEELYNLPLFIFPTDRMCQIKCRRYTMLPSNGASKPRLRNESKKKTSMWNRIALEKSSWHW
jgi:hypothetical protein